MFEYFDAKNKVVCNLKNLMFLLKQVCKVYLILKEKSEREECLLILGQFIRS
jgi:hypothetical protein